MGRKKKSESTSSFMEGLRTLKEESRHTILAIILAVISLIFVLAGFHAAGTGGEYLFKFFDLLLGVGYYLVPIVLLMVSVNYFRSLTPQLVIFQAIGGTILFISGLSLIALLSPTYGGALGRIVASPLSSFLGIPASVIVLTGLVLVSIILMYDTPLRFNIFTKNENMVDDDEIIVSSDENGASATTNQNDEEDLPVAVTTYTPQKTSKKELSVESDYKPISQYIPFTPPPLSILAKDKGTPSTGDIKASANLIKRTLQNFGIPVEMDEVTIGPSVTRYALKPAEGVKLSKILALQNNLELALAAYPIRIEAPIPGKSLVGIEVPNTSRSTVGLASLIGGQDFQSSEKPLLISLGKGITGKSQFADLAKAPHMLIAGATGSGKSVTIHTLITSLLYRNSPTSLKFIMVDPKRVELTLYNGIPHLLTPVITDAKKAILSLKWATKEMERRYDVLGKEKVRDIQSYHKTVLEPYLKKHDGEMEEDGPEVMPYIVVIIDELADIMQAYPRELEAGIVRLAQMSRAVGIHLVLSTQRPSVNVITGLIKANVPARIALQVASQIDSRTILDMAGAEKLLGAGDMLFLSGDMAKPGRIQSAFISEEEVKNLVDYLAKTYEDILPDEIDLGGASSTDITGNMSLDDNDTDDDLYEDARQAVIEAGKASTSYLQRKLRIGYSRAARLIDILEERGVIGEADGSKPRPVINAGFGDGETSDKDDEE